MAEQITSQTSETDEEPKTRDLDLPRVRDHKRDQDDEQGDRDTRIEVEACAMRFAREARARGLADSARSLESHRGKTRRRRDWCVGIHLALLVGGHGCDIDREEDCRLTEAGP